MKTKLGDEVPADLAEALQASPSMLRMWERLRPSCQRSYVRLVTEAKREETRRRRVTRVLKMTADYYARHSTPDAHST